MRLQRIVVGVMALAIVLAACGSSSKSSSTKQPSGATTPATTQQDKSLGRGVTATEIKIGVALPDFDCVKQFIDFVREGQQQIYQSFIDYINAHGGVAGRQLKPVFQQFCPIPNQQLLAQVCTKFTDDEKVFAVIGNVFDDSGVAQTCIAKQHKTALMVFDLTRAIVGKQPPGSTVFPGTFPERIDTVLAKLMQQQHTLDGKTVGILGEQGTKSAITSTLEPALKGIGAKLAPTAILAISGSDTTAAQSQLDSIVDRWKSDGVNAVFVSGEQVVAKQFVDKVVKGLPGVLLITDTGDAKMQAQDEVKSGVNSYQGMLYATGPTSAEYDASANWKYCADIYKAQTGKVAPNQEAVIPVPGDPSKRLDTYGSISDACQTTTLLKEIGDKVGQYLNINNWQNVVNTFGPIRDPGGGQFASLGMNKYDTNDTFRLSEFDAKTGKNGDWKPITPLENIPSEG